MIAEESLGRLRALALAAGADDLAAEAAAMAERLREERFNVACVGQFKRGKSTLLNALVGQAVLPTGVPPVTSVPTILRHGQVGARVRTREGWTPFPPAQVAEYVAEQLNPGNRKGVLAVELLLPAAVLEDGLCLVDTPGLGSVSEANAAATREFVPHVDAALVVLGADPPISGEELRLVEAIAEEADTLLFVLNKVDRVTEVEREQAIEFVQEVLRDRLGRVGEPICQVTAIGGGGGPDWITLVERLRTLASSHRAVLVGRALRRGLARVGGTLAGRVREKRDALNRPITESEARVEELRRLSETADRTLRDLNPLFAAEEQRLSTLFSDKAEEFLDQARPVGLATLRAAWTAGRFDRSTREETLEFTNQLARSLVLPWLARSEAEAETAYRDATRRFSSLANEHLARVAALAGTGPERPAPIEPGAEGFRIRRHFAFHDLMRFHYPLSPWPSLIDALVPRLVRRRRRQGRAEAYLAELLTVNASRVAGDLAERVRESRRELEAEIRETLRRVSQAAGNALEWARAVQARGAEEVRRESERLSALLEEIDRLTEPAGDRAA
jgi:GTP-binding protein EngB required for normal cell division/BMFP domain-containing protein YqiC